MLHNVEFTPLTLFSVILLGWLLGSFCTVLAYRIPRDIPLGLTSHTRSFCTSCEKVIPWYRNVPLFAYLFLRGRCADCKARIPLRYFLIELSTLILFVTTYLVYENSPYKPVYDFAYWAELIKLLYFTLALVATTFIDLEFRIIPDRFSMGNCIIALAAAGIWSRPDFFSSVLGAAFGAGSFFLLGWTYEKIKKVEGLGFGDVKMMGWLGAWVGIVSVPFLILVASLSGLVVGLIAMRKSKDGLQTAIPFGPFLALGAYVAWVLDSYGYFH